MYKFLKARCPRCGGNTIIEYWSGRAEISCLQCSRNLIDKISKPMLLKGKLVSNKVVLK